MRPAGIRPSEGILQPLGLPWNHRDDPTPIFVGDDDRSRVPFMFPVISGASSSSLERHDFSSWLCWRNSDEHGPFHDRSQVPTSTQKSAAVGKTSSHVVKWNGRYPISLE